MEWVVVVVTSSLRHGRQMVFPLFRRATREGLKQAADFVKIMVGGGVASETDGIETCAIFTRGDKGYYADGLADGEEDGKSPSLPFV